MTNKTDSGELFRLLKQGCNELGIDLKDEAAKKFLMYLKELQSWNRTTNLTAITDEKDIIIRHFLDSLTILPIIQKSAQGALKLLDIGAGAGFPGIPLKVAEPRLDVTLVESREKKVFFMRHIIRTLGLGMAIRAVAGRAGETAFNEKYGNSFDIVTSRAFTNLKDFLKIALPVCAPGGRVIAIKGPSADKELLSVNGVAGPEVIKVKVPFEKRTNTLVVFTKPV